MLTTAKGAGVNGQPVSLPVFSPIGAVQNVNYNASGGASTQSSAFAAVTEAVLITLVTSNVRIQLGSNPTAAGGTTLLPAPGAYVFAVPKGQSWKLAVLGNDATTGAICVTELGSDVFN